MAIRNLPNWQQDSKHWRGRVLTGFYCHWCDGGWDGLPIDETCQEWPCECADELVKELGTPDSPRPTKETNDAD